MKKINRTTTKDLAKGLYMRGYSIAKIAEILHKNIRTINNYKTKEWDMQRADFFSELKDNKGEVYQNFIEEMYLAIKEIRESDLGAEKKAQALSKLGDSFAKMNKVASLENPKVYRLSLIKRTLEFLLEDLRVAGEIEAINAILNRIENHNLTEKLANLEA